MPVLRPALMQGDRTILRFCIYARRWHQTIALCPDTDGHQQLPKADKVCLAWLVSYRPLAVCAGSTARLRLPDGCFPWAPPARTPTIPRAAARGCPRLVALSSAAVRRRRGSALPAAKSQPGSPFIHDEALRARRRGALALLALAGCGVAQNMGQWVGGEHCAGSHCGPSKEEKRLAREEAQRLEKARAGSERGGESIDLATVARKPAAFVLNLSGHHDHPACNGKYTYGGVANGKPQWVKEAAAARRSSGRARRGTVSGAAIPPRRR